MPVSTELEDMLETDEEMVLTEDTVESGEEMGSTEDMVESGEEMGLTEGTGESGELMGTMEDAESGEEMEALEDMTEIREKMVVTEDKAESREERVAMADLCESREEVVAMEDMLEIREEMVGTEGTLESGEEMVATEDTMESGKIKVMVVTEDTLEIREEMLAMEDIVKSGEVMVATEDTMESREEMVATEDMVETIEVVVTEDTLETEEQMISKEAERIETEDMGAKNKRKNLTTKVGTGGHRRYFRQGAKKRKYQISIVEGQDVVFESAGHIFVGRGSTKSGSNSYKVYSENREREFTLSWSQHPKMLQELKVSGSETELIVGKTFLVVWQLHADDFLQLVPAQVVSNHGTYSWMKPAAAHHKGCIRVDHKDILHLNRTSHQLHADVGKVTIDHGEANVAFLMLQATQTQLEELNNTYSMTLHKLQDKIKESEQLKLQIEKLNRLNTEAKNTIRQYKAQLFKSQALNQAANTLYKVISDQKDMLDNQAKQLLQYDKVIDELRRENHRQEEELSAATTKISQLEEENTQLKHDRQSCNTEHQGLQDLTNKLHNIEKENKNLQQQCRILTTSQQGLFKLHKSQESNHLVARSVTQEKRGTTLLPITKPVQASSTADARTLKRRADEVDKVGVLSNYKTNSLLSKIKDKQKGIFMIFELSSD